MATLVTPQPMTVATAPLSGANVSTGQRLPVSRRAFWMLVQLMAYCSLSRQMSKPSAALPDQDGWQIFCCTGIICAHVCSVVSPLQMECLWTPT